MTESSPEQPPHALHERAFDNLRYIRDTMDRAASFTAVSGWGYIVAGITAIGAAAFAAGGADDLWLRVWLLEAALGLALTTGFSIRKARRAGVSLKRGSGRRFLLGFAPPALAAVCLTPALLTADAVHLLPGLWLLLYGAATTTAGAYSVRAVPAMGLAFMVVGVLAFILPAARDVWLALGFGGLHVIFGSYIARRHGG